MMKLAAVLGVVSILWVIAPAFAGDNADDDSGHHCGRYRHGARRRPWTARPRPSGNRWWSLLGGTEDPGSKRTGVDAGNKCGSIAHPAFYVSLRRR
jgi:hypothetical protein